MSDTTQGPGWWQATDGHWYAPQTHPLYPPPDVVLAATVVDDVSGQTGTAAAANGSPDLPPPSGYFGSGSVPLPVVENEQPTARKPRWRRYVLVSLIVIAVALLGTTAFFVVTNEIGTHNQLRMERSAFRRVSSQLAQAQSNLSNANGQISNLQNKVSNLQGTVSTDQQAASDINAVANSLETCVADTNQFESDFTTELEDGVSLPSVSDEASEADTACGQAESQYNTLQNALNSAT
jgi:hypothetical protein